MAFATIDVTKGITGVTPVANGGTGATSYTPGKLLQVQSFSSTDSISTTSTSFVATILTDQITPSATDSKIIILVNGGRGSYSSGACEGQVKLYRQINGGGYSAYRNMHLEMVHGGSDGYGKPSASFNYIDSNHSTTNAIDYKVYIKTNANGWTFNSGSSNMSILLMEIAA